MTAIYCLIWATVHAMSYSLNSSLVNSKHVTVKKDVKTGGVLTVWMYACGNTLRFTVFSNTKQFEFTFKIVVKMGIGKNAFLYFIYY